MSRLRSRISMKPKNIKMLQARSRQLITRWLDSNTILVKSTTDPSIKHKVRVHFNRDGSIDARCTCQWAQYQGTACSHVMAALEYMAGLKNRTLSFWSSEEEAERQKHRRFYLKGSGHSNGIWITSRAD